MKKISLVLLCLSLWAYANPKPDQPTKFQVPPPTKSVGEVNYPDGKFTRNTDYSVQETFDGMGQTLIKLQMAAQEISEKLQQCQLQKAQPLAQDPETGLKKAPPTGQPPLNVPPATK